MKIETIKKYYPFWLGLIVCIALIGFGSQHGWSFAVFGAYIMGYFNLTKLH